MRHTKSAALLTGTVAMLALPAAMAAERLQVVTSFSILADMARNVGGEQVEVRSLVGPDSDAHMFSASPRDARALADADLVVFNGLQFEGWMERLIESSEYSGTLVIATDGIEKRSYHDHAHDHHDHNDHDHGEYDPHAWQDLTLSRVYVGNIRDGLIAADPDNESVYRENAGRYINELDLAHAEISELLAEIPASTSVITGHASFGYFADAYGMHFLSPMGLSTEAEPSAADMAQLVGVIRERNVRALFHENMTSPAVINQLAEETGLPVAGTLYADALAAEGEAGTYLGMLHHNARVLHAALAEPGHNDHDHDHDHDHNH